MAAVTIALRRRQMPPLGHLLGLCSALRFMSIPCAELPDGAEEAWLSNNTEEEV
jgi:hypothetical protein